MKSNIKVLALSQSFQTDTFKLFKARMITLVPQSEYVICQSSRIHDMRCSDFMLRNPQTAN